MLKGIDVSHHQGIINWGKVVADFVFIKATEEESFVDQRFKANWIGAQTHNIPVGAYHFFNPAKDAGIQAKHFCDVLLSVTGKRLPPVLDIEKTGGVSQSLILKKVKKWLDYVAQATDQVPIIYTYPAFLKQIRLSKTCLDYPLWIANYRVEVPQIDGWPDWTFWQYNDRGKIPGINGLVDVNYYSDDKDTLKALLV